MFSLLLIFVIGCGALFIASVISGLRPRETAGRKTYLA